MSNLLKYVPAIAVLKKNPSFSFVYFQTQPGALRVSWRPTGAERERTGSTLLQTQPAEDLLELGVCAELGELDVHAAAQAGSQVGGAGEHVAQMLVPHEAVVVALEDRLDLEDKRRRNAIQ